MFYDAVADPYCYPGTTVLKNRLGLKTQVELDIFEHDMTAQRFDEPLPSGRLSVAHYRAIHRHLFQDVYAWAGQFRAVRIAKNNSMFCYPEHIAPEMAKLFQVMRKKRHLAGLPVGEFAHEAAHFLAELNAIHPFREGNGRTQLVFLTLLALKAGHPLQLEALEPENFLQAMVSSFQGDQNRLEQEISAMVRP